MLADTPEFIGRLVAIENGALHDDHAAQAAHAALQDLAKNKDVKKLIDAARYDYVNHPKFPSLPASPKAPMSPR